jgi:fibronectin type 3 domain-containing protein
MYGKTKRTANGRDLWLVLVVLVCGALGLCGAKAGGTWTALNAAPPLGVNNCMLLSDGTVLGMNGAGQCVKLTPDMHGSYVNGTWTILATMNNSRLFFSSQLLTNGNLWVAGGEDGTGGTSSELYTPLNNIWTLIPAPASGYPNFSDSISEILPDGNPLVCPVYTSTACLIYNVLSNSWQTAASCHASQDEAHWVKLPGDNILTIDAFSQNSEHYIPSLNEWVSDGSVPVAMYDSSLGELGSGHLLPNGNVFYLGSTTNTAIYTPGSTATSAGSWVAGPTMVFGTNQLGQSDAPSAMMVNGKILCCLGPSATYNGPCSFYEYDYTLNAFIPVSAPGGGSTLGNTAPLGTSMLDLPDGTVLFVDGQNAGSLYVYTPDGTPLPAGQPAINSISQNRDGSYHLTGTGLNGISEGATYGDDEQMNGNYPLVRLTNSITGNVYYARTYNWSSTSVMTGSQVVTTEFALPRNLPAGIYSLVVTAVGNPSAPVLFTNQPPAAPTGLSGTAGNAQASLSWNSVSGATAYNVRRLTTAGTAFYATVATVTDTNFTDVGLVNAFGYSYVVTAVSPGGESANSSTLIVTPAGPPPAPTGVTATSDAFARIYLAWNASYGATTYNIKRAPARTGAYVNLASSPNPFYTDSGLANGATYYYVISAVSAEGESTNSAIVSAVAQPIVDFGFEVPNIGSGNYQYTPMGAFWTFTGTNGNGSGLIANGSGFSNPNAPQGVQAAFVQSNGVISQVLSGFAPGTVYTITYSAAQRSGASQHGGESWNVTIDGTVIKSNTPGPSSYTTYTAVFTASAVTHALAFVGTDLASGDNTVFLDNIRISPTLQPMSPGIVLTTPTNNSSLVGLPVVNLAATVVTNGNVISGVQFYYDTTNLIGQVNNPPYNYGWVNPNTGNYTVFARVIYNGGSVADSLAASVAVINTNVDFSFETPSIGFGNYQYDPANASWTFDGASGNGSGLIANGSGFNNPNAPQGVQAAFVQGFGSVSQMLYGFTPGTIYTITYSAAQRSGANQNGGESWNVMIDNTVIATNNPGTSSYANYTATFTASASTHVLAFVGTDIAGGDNSVFLDNVRISPPISQVPPSVALTTPANNSVFSAAGPVDLAAIVTTNGNTIVGVQFYSNTNSFITQVTAPYTYAWSNASAGASTVFARLVFNGSNTVDSGWVDITVTNPPPVANAIGLDVTGQTLNISGSGLSSRPYFLTAASNLAPPVVWAPILTNLSDSAGNISFTNIIPTNGQQFYRISAP